MISVGFIGAGFAAKLHADALRLVHGTEVRLAAVASANPESAARFAKAHRIPDAYRNYRDLLDDPSIDVVSICAPNSLHADLVMEAARAGKHVICEKPLTGAFGPSSLSGAPRARDEYSRALESTDRIASALDEAGVLFFYAEDWIYAPSVSKAKRLIETSKGTVLDIRAEQSHSGSHAASARRRETAGGGSLITLGAHPIAAAIHLKGGGDEGRADSSTVRVASVSADVGLLQWPVTDQRKSNDWLVSDWQDVETWASTVLTFDDGTKALVTASFARLGGVRNSFEVYTTNTAIRGNITPNDGLMAYTPDPEAFGDEYLHEKAETRTGWIAASPDEDWARGYPQEMQDFMECIVEGRLPVSGFQLARSVIDVVYASYLSAEEGRRVDLSLE